MTIKSLIERIVLSCKWLLVPVYVGMMLSLILLVVKFFQELGHMSFCLTQCTESQLVLGILSLIDMVLVSNLLVMVIISGYEAFISPISENPGQEKPGWLSKLDPGTVKIKLAASIVGISSIHLLTAFLNIKEFIHEKILWLVVMHLTFVLSALLLAVIDRVAFAKHRTDPDTP